MRRSFAALLLSSLILGACATAAKAPTDKAGQPLGLPVGTPAPDIAAFDGQGQAWTLRSVPKPATILFFRGKWCPFCIRQLQDLNEKLSPVVKETGVQLYVLSVDTPAEADATRKKFKLSFPLLSLPGPDVLRAYHVANEVKWADKPAIAHPSVFVLDNDGKVSWMHVDVDYKSRVDPAEIAKAMRKVAK